MTIFQIPNPPLIAAGIGFLLSKIPNATIQHIGDSLFIASLTIWSYLEITKGASLFRKILGLAVMIFVLIKLFNLFN